MDVIFYTCEKKADSFISLLIYWNTASDNVPLAVLPTCYNVLSKGVYPVLFWGWYHSTPTNFQVKQVSLFHLPTYLLKHSLA